VEYENGTRERNSRSVMYQASMSWQRTCWASAGAATIEMVIDVVRSHVGHLVYNAHSCKKVADAGMTRSKL
jgi:hypothetical protein